VKDRTDYVAWSWTVPSPIFLVILVVGGWALQKHGAFAKGGSSEAWAVVGLFAVAIGVAIGAHYLVKAIFGRRARSHDAEVEDWCASVGLRFEAKHAPIDADLIEIVMPYWRLDVPRPSHPYTEGPWAGREAQAFCARCMTGTDGAPTFLNIAVLHINGLYPGRVMLGRAAGGVGPRYQPVRDVALWFAQSGYQLFAPLLGAAGQVLAGGGGIPGYAEYENRLGADPGVACLWKIPGLPEWLARFAASGLDPHVRIHIADGIVAAAGDPVGGPEFFEPALNVLTDLANVLEAALSPGLDQPTR
jgi:hypothetical protein